jgi:hypothetical protein
MWQLGSRDQEDIATPDEVRPARVSVTAGLPVSLSPSNVLHETRPGTSECTNGRNGWLKPAPRHSPAAPDTLSQVGPPGADGARFVELGIRLDEPAGGPFPPDRSSHSAAVHISASALAHSGLQVIRRSQALLQSRHSSEIGELQDWLTPDSRNGTDVAMHLGATRVSRRAHGEQLLHAQRDKSSCSRR